MPMTQKEEREMKVTAFMDALQNYVRAEIHDQKPDEEPDIMGTYHEQKALRETLEDLL